MGWSCFAIIGALLQLIGITFYIYKTLRGTVRPNRVTWLLWAIAPLIAAVAAFAEGVRWAILPVFMAGFGPLLVFCASFLNRSAYWQLGKLDYICGALAVLGLMLWAVTRTPEVAIIFAALADGFAAVPTLVKCWKAPESESSASFTTGFAGSVAAVLAAQTLSFAEVGFALYLAALNALLIVTLVGGRARMRAAGLRRSKAMKMP